MPGAPATTRAGTRPTSATRAADATPTGTKPPSAEAVKAASPKARREKRAVANADAPAVSHAATIKGVDVADVGDALAGGLRVTTETIAWLVWSVLLGIRTAAITLARAWVVAWPTLTSVFPRFAWWGALLLLYVGGTALLDAFAPPERFAWLPMAFAVGLGLAVIPAFLARATHLRVFGVALAAAHGSALLLVWMVQAG
jgi:hypothetical protein